jgi:hypothetical protein
MQIRHYCSILFGDLRTGAGNSQIEGLDMDMKGIKRPDQYTFLSVSAKAKRSNLLVNKPMLDTAF